MTALDAKKAIQDILQVAQDGQLGPKSLAAYNTLAVTPDGSTWPLSDPKGWPFVYRVDGEDAVCENVVITCFGGLFDPQDNGKTASGANTRLRPDIEGVSIAMDGRLMPHLSAEEHASLDGAPIGLVPWFTPVEVTINGVTYTPKAGIIDLCPGRQASKPGEPHALDLTVAAASHFAPAASLRELAENFEARGSFRIKGGAKYLTSCA